MIFHTIIALLLSVFFQWLPWQPPFNKSVSSLIVCGLSQMWRLVYFFMKHLQYCGWQRYINCPFEHGSGFSTFAQVGTISANIHLQLHFKMVIVTSISWCRVVQLSGINLPWCCTFSMFLIILSKYRYYSTFPTPWSLSRENKLHCWLGYHFCDDQ